MKPLSDLQAEWPALSRLLDEALDLPPAERAGWLAALPVADELKRTLSDLLALPAAVETGDFLQTLPKLGDDGLRRLASGAPEGAPQPGDAVGPWRLLSVLGEGGMGTVWLAERADGSLQRQVALKLPRLAWAGGMAERLARERHILATLEHPRIARLYDAGVDRLGRPWLALELVQGVPIDRHAADRALSTAQRLELLLQVCEAVAYAHSRLVTHRDLKPGNILVTDDGQVRLLDFGIAKLMQADRAEATALTEVSGRALTLDYASPEQVRGEALTTASDVYSLGVVAYELLAGARPYRLKRGSAAELEEAIATADLLRASERAATPQAKQALKGDLDAILAKALKKQPGERYATVDAFAQDLRRHLRHEPVSAQPEAFAYLAAKLLARYRLQVAAAASVVVALLVGLAAAWTQAQRAEEQRAAAVEANAQALRNQREAERQAALAQAERATAQAERAAAQAATERAEATAVREQAERRKAQQAAAAERVAAQRAQREAMRAEQVKAFVLSLFERADTEAGAGTKTTALELLQQARERIDRELQSEPAVAFELKSSLARSLGALGDYQGALQIVEGLVGPQAPRLPAVPPTMETDARIMYAEWLPRIGRNAEGLDRLREIERATRQPGTPRAQRVATLRMLSVALLESGNAYTEAVEWAERAARLADGAADVPAIVQLRAWMALANARQIARQPGVLEPARRALGLAEKLYPAKTAEPVLEARQFVALGFAAEGRFREALGEYRTLRDARIELLGPRHNSLAALYNSMGNAHLQAGEPVEALASYQALVAVVDANDRGPTLNRAIGRFRVANALASLRRHAEATEMQAAALAMSESLSDPRHARNMRWRGGLAAFQAQSGDLVAAEATLAGVDPAGLADGFDRAEASLRIGTVRSLQGRYDEALKALGDAEQFLRHQSNATMRSSARVGLALAHFRAGRAGEHLDAIAEAEREMASADSARSPDLADLRMALGRARLDRGDADGALASLNQAVRFWDGFAADSRDAARARGQLALVLAARGELQAAGRAADHARQHLATSPRADDRRLLGELARAGF